MQNTVEQQATNALRILSIDGVQRANSGHPGMPMGAAAMAYTLWTNFLRHNPANPAWPDRDRFLMGKGHAAVGLFPVLADLGYLEKIGANFNKNVVLNGSTSAKVSARDSDSIDKANNANKMRYLIAHNRSCTAQGNSN